ncbi:hypothetical protein [Streptomyces sp. JHA26]|uniref:hypothetical protein n=1 Tax=Streptomyces sp. JHA26 TaxID=1917143 RepID=UPI00209B55BD|nr:hypothetical protein [Streptomyces sp. JHA26]
MRAAVDGGSEPARRVRTALARAVGGVLTAAVSLTDPDLIVIGGEWGGQPRMLAALDDHFARSPRRVRLAAATVPTPELTAARMRAVEELRALIIRSAHPGGE